MTELYNEKGSNAGLGAGDVPNIWLERIANALKGIRFGAVEIVIHEGRVVQIERREKVRFDPPRDNR